MTTARLDGEGSAAGVDGRKFSAGDDAPTTSLAVTAAAVFREPSRWATQRRWELPEESAGRAGRFCARAIFNIQWKSLKSTHGQRQRCKRAR